MFTCCINFLQSLFVFFKLYHWATWAFLREVGFEPTISSLIWIIDCCINLLQDFFFSCLYHLGYSRILNSYLSYFLFFLHSHSKYRVAKNPLYSSLLGTHSYFFSSTHPESLHFLHLTFSIFTGCGIWTYDHLRVKQELLPTELTRHENRFHDSS